MFNLALRSNIIFKALLLLLFISGYCNATPLRVVSLSPVSTEVVSLLNANSLVGVSTYCNYPDSVTHLPKVGDITINYEKVLSLNPDKIIGIGMSTLSKEKFESLGYSTLFLESPESIKDILLTIDKIGIYLGESKPATELIASMNRALLALKKNKPKHVKDVVVLLQNNPIIVAGSNGYISELLELSGGRYPLPTSKITYPRIPRELLLDADPEVIICGYPTLKNQLLQDRVILMTRAGQDGRIINTIDADLFLRPGPRIIEGIEAIRNVLK
jgi:iron complex transport system substrate-binding protein